MVSRITSLLFGLLEFHDAEKHGGVFWYLFLAYGSRIVAGIGCGLTDTSLYALIAAGALSIRTHTRMGTTYDFEKKSFLS